MTPPAGGFSGRGESELNYQVKAWNRQYRLGVVFSSQTVFRLDNGLRRMPDTAWVHLERWESLTPQEQAGIVPLAPDVAFELRSPSDQLKHL